MTVVCGRGDRSGLPGQNGSVVEQYELDGFKVIQLKVAYSQKMSFLRRLLAFAWFVLLSSWVALRQRDVDVILASSTPLTIVIPALVASRIKRIPFVFEVRDLWPDVPIGMGVLRNRFLIACARSLEQLAYRSAAHIIALSPGMRDGVISSGAPAEKITVIPNACDNDLFDVPPELGLSFLQRHPYLKDRLLVLYAGAFGKVNGLDYLIRLAHKVQGIDKSIAFILVGEGRDRFELENMARELGILNNGLWILDGVPKHSISEILSASDIAVSTVIPNRVLWNNSANKFFDALAAGRPVAINHGGWQADLLTDTGAGIVLPPDDLRKAAELLIGFLHSESRVEQARKAARVLARERFDRNLLVIEMEGVLERVVRKPSRAGYSEKAPVRLTKDSSERQGLVSSNVLVLCGGKWVGLVLQLKRAMREVAELHDGRIFVADKAPLTAAGSFADASFIVPSVSDPDYVDCLIDICSRHAVRVVVPLIDLDVARLAPQSDRFLAIGTTVVCPTTDLVETCLDKNQFERFANEHGLDHPQTYALDELDLAPFPLFFKRRRGFGSIGSGMCESPSEARAFLDRTPDLIFQEYITAPEVSVDAYISAAARCTVRVQRIRVKVLGGEAFQSRTIKSQAVRKLASRTIDALAARGLKGPLNVQMFDGDRPTLIEVNTRLGSGSVLSNQASGGRLFRSVLTEACGGSCEGDPEDYKEDLQLLRYFGDVFCNGSEPAQFCPSRDAE